MSRPSQTPDERYQIINGPLLLDAEWRKSPYIRVAKTTAVVRLIVEQNSTRKIVEYRVDHATKQLKFRRYA